MGRFAVALLAAVTMGIAAGAADADAGCATQAWGGCPYTDGAIRVAFCAGAGAKAGSARCLTESSLRIKDERALARAFDALPTVATAAFAGGLTLRLPAARWDAIVADSALTNYTADGMTSDRFSHAVSFGLSLGGRLYLRGGIVVLVAVSIAIVFLMVALLVASSGSSLSRVAAAALLMSWGTLWMDTLYAIQFFMGGKVPPRSPPHPTYLSTRKSPIAFIFAPRLGPPSWHATAPPLTVTHHLRIQLSDATFVVLANSMVLGIAAVGVRLHRSHKGPTTRPRRPQEVAQWWADADPTATPTQGR